MNARGRFLIVVTEPHGLTWRCESLKEKSLSPVEIRDALREYANFIDTCFVKPALPAGPQAQEPPSSSLASPPVAAASSSPEEQP